MASPPPSVLVMGAGEAGPELGDLLGAERAADVERLLRERALRWASDLSPGGIHFPADSEGLADAVRRVFSEAGGGAVLVIWPALPHWGPEHAQGVLDDLASGCDASVGPVFDGGLYMLALTRMLPALFALPGATWDSPDAMGRVLGAINEEGAAVGLLRAERGLRREADVRAALADPLLDAELRAVLAG